MANPARKTWQQLFLRIALTPDHRIYKTTLKAILPLPDPDAPVGSPAHLNVYPEFPVGSTVMALYPDTSCFYRAEVIATPDRVGAYPDFLSLNILLKRFIIRQLLLRNMSLLIRLSLKTMKGWSTRYQLSGLLNFLDIFSRIYSVNLCKHFRNYLPSFPVGFGLEVYCCCFFPSNFQSFSESRCVFRLLFNT
jgi:hypothetical protein